MDLRMTPLFAESWSVAYRRKSIGSLIDDRDTPFSLIPNNLDCWAADPMVFTWNGKTYIFAELYSYSQYRGVIGVSEYDGKRFTKWKKVLEEKTHLSYPFVFAYDGQIYMLPENRDSNSLTLYRAVDFPNLWESCKTIAKDVQWVDTTIVQTQDGFAGFTESLAGPIADYELRLNENFDILSCKKLVNSGNACLRCAGPIYQYNGMLLRATQECRNDYGEAFFLRLCDPKSLEEKEVYHVTPRQLRFQRRIFLRGMHTYSATDEFEVIDIKTRRLSPLNLFYRVLGKLKGLRRINK